MATISGLYAKLTKIVPEAVNTIDNTILLSWINTCEYNIDVNLLAEHKLNEGETRPTLPYTNIDNTELVAKAPYDELYIHYLAGMVYFYLKDYETYNGEITLYDKIYGDYAKYYHRTHETNKTTKLKLL